MPQINNSDAMSHEAFRAAIILLQAQHRRWRKTGSKRALYVFLHSVFECYSDWHRHGVALEASARVAKLTGLNTQHHPERTSSLH